MKCEWKEVELSGVADLTVGFVGTMASHYTDNGVLFLRSTNIEPFNIKMDDVKYISPEFNETIKKSQLNPDDVVIVRTGKPGACTVIPQKTEPWNCSDLVIIHPNKEKINPHFLASYINLASGVINAHLVGAVQQHFNVGAAKKMKIPLPSIDIQNRIASIIQGLNDKIELNNKINENLERQAQAIFYKWFISTPQKTNIVQTEFGMLPTSFAVVKTGDLPLTVMDYVANGSFATLKANVKVYQEPNYAYFIRNTDLKSGTFEVFVDEHSYNFLSKSRLFGGEIIISNVGDVGCVFLCPTLDAPMTLGNNIIMLKPEEKNLRYYLYVWFKWSLGQGLIQGIKSGSAQPKFNKTDFKALPVILPPDELLDKFHETVSPMFDLIGRNQSENRKLATLRNALLPKLMSGEIKL